MKTHNQPYLGKRIPIPNGSQGRRANSYYEQLAQQLRELPAGEAIYVTRADLHTQAVSFQSNLAQLLKKRGVLVSTMRYQEGVAIYPLDPNSRRTKKL